MGKITDIPTGITGAGQDFDYTEPIQLARIDLVNAPLDPAHTNTIRLTTMLDHFIDLETAAGRCFTATDLNIQDPAHNLTLPIAYQDTGDYYNYGRLTIGTRKWYIFYSAEYVNKTSTRFVADIDEWLSYDWALGYSMIERGHAAVAASQTDTYGANYLTAPEPIDAPPVRGILSADILGSASSQWTVLVTSTNNLNGEFDLPNLFFEQHVNNTEIVNAHNTASAATIDSAAHITVTVPQSNFPWASGAGPVVYVPHVTPSPLSTIDGVACGGGAYLFTMTGFAEYMTIMQGAPWVTDGITDIRLVPAWALPPGGNAAFVTTTPPTSPTDALWGTAASIPSYRSTITTTTASPSVLAGWRDTALAAVGGTGWTKLLTSQFTDILVGNGDSTTRFKPDQWQTSALSFQAVTGAAHGDPSIRLIPNGYNELGEQMGIDTPVGGRPGLAKSGYALAASNVGAQDLSTYLNAYSSFTTWQTMQQQKTLAVTLGLTKVQMNLGQQGIQTALGGLTGAAGGALTGGPIGAAIGVASAASGLAGLVTSAITASNAINILDISTDGSFDIGAFQLGVSGLSAYNTFNTWVQTLEAHSGSGSAHQLASAWRAILSQAFQAIIAMPSQERIRKLISEWTRYGYMIGQAFTPTQLNCMSSYTYWQTTDALITGAVPQSRRQTIAAAFDRGVTVWESVAAIGTKPTNTPLPGITY